MIAISTIFLLIVLSTCDGKSRFHKDCLIDKVDFATKVEDSSIVVYGKTVGKMLYGGNETTFYVSFQVDCILKGPAIVKQINITDAGKISFNENIQIRFSFKVKLKIKPIVNDFLLVVVTQSHFLNEIH
jgi:hypothetical protein